MNGNLGNYIRGITNGILTFQCDDGFIPSVPRTAVCSDSSNIWNPLPDEYICIPVEGDVL